MNKRKLVQIIVKDLEELKILSEEVAEIKGDASLIIDLALSKTRLLIQEIELLREASELSEAGNEELEEETYDEGDDVMVSDPELEILNFEEQESREEDESPQEETFEAELDEEEIEEEDNEEEQEIETELEPEFEVGAEDKADLNEEADENTTEEEESEESEETEDSDDEEEIDEEDDIESEEDDEFEEESENIQPKPAKEVSELKTEQQPGVREIHIEDLDDEPDTVQFEPISDSTGRPVMREIPKPDDQVQEKTVAGESFQKERSLNDTVGENKSGESKLINGPISSLRAAIGLNDRFLFIREIFDNNADKYNTIIDHLDKLETIQQAVDYLKANLTLQKNETSMKFVELLKRRFSK